MTRPLITIGVTTFNAAETVSRAVQSALRQSWRPIEIIVVDDASSDNTVSLLGEFAERYPELKVLTCAENRGVAAARNRIVDTARGEYIAFFDDDDESSPMRLERQVNRLEEYEESYASGAPVICHSARRLLYPVGHEQIAGTMGQREAAPAPAGIAVAERILLGKPLADGYGACPTCSQLARTDTYRDLDGFDPTFRRSEDTEFNVRLAKAGGHFIGIADPLVTQFMTKTSDKSLGDEQVYMRRLLDKHRDVADRYGLYEFCSRWIDVKEAWLEKRYLRFGAKLAGLAATQPRHTLQRLALSLPNRQLNSAFRRFHRHQVDDHG